MTTHLNPAQLSLETSMGRQEMRSTFNMHTFLFVLCVGAQSLLLVPRSTTHNHVIRLKKKS